MGTPVKIIILDIIFRKFTANCQRSDAINHIHLHVTKR